MEDEYDVVVCGTGLVECILSGLLSQEGKKVLHIDRNPYYGGEGASLNLTNLYKIFRPDEKAPDYLGANRDWNIDLIPKYIMSNGKLVKILLKTKVARYLEWKSIDGTYVFQISKGGMFSKGGARIGKVPATDKEAVSSDLMGLLEKKRVIGLYKYLQKFDRNDPKTYDKFNHNQSSANDLMKKYNLDGNTVDYLGHALALFADDKYLTKPAIQTIDKIQLYMDSIGRYGDSPFIYPVYGLGGIPEGFSRMCAIHGGTFMLNTDIDEFVFDENGKVSGVKSGDQTAKCKQVICDPSYVNKCKLENKVKCTGRVIRTILLLDHPIPNTKDIPSVQIILPQRQTGRKSDIYIMMVSSVHNVCKKGMYIAIVSTMVETSKPEDELQPAINLIGNIKESFTTISEIYAPINPVVDDGIFVSNSFGPISHFEEETENVLELYKQLHEGTELDLINLPDDNEFE